MHDSLNPKRDAVPVEQEMAVKRSSDLNAANVRKFGCHEVARPAQVGLSSHLLNRFMHGQQVMLCGLLICILEVPAVLQGHVLLGPRGDGDSQAHACAPAF